MTVSICRERLCTITAIIQILTVACSIHPFISVRTAEVRHLTDVCVGNHRVKAARQDDMGVVKGILQGSVKSPSSQTYIYLTHRSNHDHHQNIFVQRPTRVFTDENFARFFPCTKSAPRALDGFVFIVIIRSSIDQPPLPRGVDGSISLREARIHSVLQTVLVVFLVKWLCICGVVL